MDRFARIRPIFPWLFGAGLAVLIYLWSPQLVQRLDFHAYDLFSAKSHDNRVSQAVIIAIDDESLAELGPWPWPRSTHAALLDILGKAGVRKVAFDLLFAEATPEDASFAEAIRRFGQVVVALAPATHDKSIAPLMPSPLINAVSIPAHIDVEIDSDGIARRIFLNAGIEEPTWPALATSMRDTTASLLPVRQPKPLGIWVRANQTLLPHPSGFSVRKISYARVLKNPALAAALRNDTIFVGVTATGINSPITTARNEPMSAVEFHARAFESLYRGTVARPVSELTTLWLGLAFTLIPAFFSWRKHLVFSTNELLLLGSLPILLSFGVLRMGGLWIPAITLSVGIWVSAALSLIDQLKTTRASLAKTQRNAEATLNAIADAVINVSPGGMIRTMNPVARQLVEATGASHLNPIGQHFSAALGLSIKATHRIDKLIESCARKSQILHASEPIRLGEKHLRVTAGSITNQNGLIDEVVLALTDITEVVGASERLYHEATHDALTSLPNRALLHEYMQQSIARFERSNGLNAVIFIDIDHFNRINDSLGHHTGDNVLIEVSKRLGAISADAGFVSRWGGDEFILIMPEQTDRDAIGRLAQRILDSIAVPADIDGLRLHLTCSIGISLIDEDSSDVDELLAMADTAMSRGKINGESGYHFYSASMSFWNREHIQLETDLRYALQLNQFELYYQPQMEPRSGRLTGLEALLRWNRPNQGLVLPDHFIPLAEDTGLITEIGVWVIREATSQLRRWADLGYELVPVAVNVSTRQCLDHRISDVIAEAIRNAGISPRYLNIELTESTTMNNVDHVASLLRSINSLGVNIAVDDFGTGYSSLSYLKRFPISQLKIDRSFVHDMISNPDDAAIVSGTIALAHGLGIEVVAEGVETIEQLNFLMARNCNVIQGYYYARPMPASEVVQFFEYSIKT